ncbi:MAG: phosphoglycerate dehydrogenase [Phycisphaerales bacterium]|nr:phosphoglycerate dehydrogenase [Phycisphaerales bacterium]
MSDRALAYLAEHAEVVRTDAENVLDHIADADGLVVRTYTQVNDELLNRAERLKVVGRAGVALENIDVPAARSRGVEVVHTPAANTLAVVDYTIAAIIRMNRRFWAMDGYVTPEEFHRMRKGSYGRFLADMTLGIVGCGRIGSRVGAAAAALGMTVLYNDIIPIELNYAAQSVDKPTLYSQSDIVTIHVPLDESTTGMIDASALEMFKDGAQFINAARGPCVNYNDLADALRAGRISGATVDCHNPEPPPEDYPMFGLENVTLTPHTAARVPQAVENMCDVVFDIIAVLQGHPPQYPAK